MIKLKLAPVCAAIALTLSSAVIPLSIQAEEKVDKWQVNAPTNANFEQVKVNVDEGTWMNLSVSPDGQHILFDLLGDIYRIPMAGGKAQALAEGIAWQMQPTYSPDGKSIAFTSDQD